MVSFFGGVSGGISLNGCYFRLEYGKDTFSALVA